MEEEEVEETSTVDGPGQGYELYLKNEELVDKLKLLNYEDGYLIQQFRPIQKHYFVVSTNVGEQFHQFTSLSAWLIRQGGNENFEMPQEFDDPNSTIANILSELRSKNVIVDVSANKLRQGVGENAIYVLDSLADLALVHTGFTWKKMIPPPEEDEDVDVDQNDEEDSDNEHSDEPDWAEDDDEAELVDLTAPTTNEDQPLQTILHSDTDVVQWKQEVERVTPLLKITIRQDAKDWRMHLEQMNTMQKTMGELIEQTNPQLDNIVTDLQASLERIESREKSLNQQMNVLLGRYRETQDIRAETREKYKSASGGVNARTEALQRISEDIEQLKQQIDEQGAKTSDGAPMVRIKQALLKMETDIQRLSVQIGVLEQGLLNAQLRDRVAYASEAYGAL